MADWTRVGDGFFECFRNEDPEDSVATISAGLVKLLMHASEDDLRRYNTRILGFKTGSVFLIVLKLFHELVPHYSPIISLLFPNDVPIIP